MPLPASERFAVPPAVADTLNVAENALTALGENCNVTLHCAIAASGCALHASDCRLNCAALTPEMPVLNALLAAVPVLRTTIFCVGAEPTSTPPKLMGDVRIDSVATPGVTCAGADACPGPAELVAVTVQE